MTQHSTPGTRLTWSTGIEWVRALEAILERRHSAARYRALDAHIAALASIEATTAFIWRQPLEDLLALQTAILKNYRRPKGLRCGTPYVAVIGEVNNAIAQARRARA